MRNRHILATALLLVLAAAVTASANYASYAPVPRTGQTTSYGTSDDGALEKGIAWPTPRFTDNEDGTVTDNLTGLIWLANADCFGTKNWTDALNAANTLNSGECGLDDGSVEGDWRLPNLRELASLIDYSQSGPALPAGYAAYFDNVPSTRPDYWTSTTKASETINAWYVSIGGGYMDASHVKASQLDHVWPVRGESLPCPPCATGGATEPLRPMMAFGPWLLLAAAVASGAITALALGRRAA